MSGCDLGPDECMSDEEIIEQSVDFYQLRANPSLLDRADGGSDIVFTPDVTFFKKINPFME